MWAAFFPALLFTTMAASSSSMKAYSPKATELDPALYPSPPDGLTLEQVNIFVRHGTTRNLF